jgi:hypothetical protein
MPVRDWGMHCQYPACNRVQLAPARRARASVPRTMENNGAHRTAHGGGRTLDAARARVGGIALCRRGTQAAAGAPQRNLREARRDFLADVGAASSPRNASIRRVICAAPAGSTRRRRRLE